MKFRKVYLQFFVDIVIALAFLAEAVSGFVLWLILPHGGFQGGRNPSFARVFILSRKDWLTLHDWGALVMVVGILIHIALHWRWIVCVLRDLGQKVFHRSEKAPDAQECPASYGQGWELFVSSSHPFYSKRSTYSRGSISSG